MITAELIILRLENINTTDLLINFVQIGFMKNGKIISLINDLYSNAGNTIDLSLPVVMASLFHADNCYKYVIC